MQIHRQPASGDLPGMHAWPEALESVARRLVPSGLFPAQEELLRRGELLEGGSGLVLAPTGSGKSVVGLLAMLSAVARGRVGMLLAPTRALACELHRLLASAAEDSGLAVALTSREARSDDEAVARGDVDCVVAVYEKGLAFLREDGPLAHRLGVLVLDEVQVVHDASRGGVIECALIEMLASRPQRPSIVAMSSCLDAPGEISAWLGLPILRSESRPIPLREGVLDLSHRIIHWSSGESDAAPNFLPDGLERGIEAFVHWLCATGRRVIVFVPTRRMAWDLGAALSAFLVNKQCLSHANMLDATGWGAAALALQPMLAAGVAVHTSELPQACRTMVEDAFREGRLKVIVATPTLAQGVNLRADVVLHWPEVAASRGDSDGFATSPLTRASFTNAGGRAGRPRGSGAEGWSLALARGEAEARRLHAALFGPMSSRTAEPPLRRLSLESLAWLFSADGSAQALQLRRLAGALITPPPGEELDLLLAEGTRLGLWKTDAGAVYRLTGAGRAVARGGCRAAFAARWARILWGTADDAASFSLVLMACEGVPGWFPGHERGVRPEETRAWRRIRTSRDALGRARAGMEPPAPSAAARALVVETLLGEDGVHGAEERHGLLGGTLEELSSEAAWQLELIAGLADHYRRPVVANLARRLSGALGRHRAQGPEPARQPPVEQPTPAVDPVPVSRPGRATVRLEFADPATGLVRFEGREVRLPPLRFDFLLALAEAGTSGIAKNDLVLRLWGDVPREEQQLFYHRREMERALLGREPAHPGELIETLPKWGFRLPIGGGEILGLDQARAARTRAA